MSQPSETQTHGTGYALAAGIMTIVASSLLLVIFLLNLVTFPSQAVMLVLPSWLGALVLDVLAILGGVFALSRRRLSFAVFGASVLIPSSLSYTLFAAVSLVFENVVLAVVPVVHISFAPAALALSALSLVFLAKSRPEFS